MNVTIIGKNNNGGLEKDRLVLTSLLEQQGITVDFRDLQEDFMPLGLDTDVCIHLEIVDMQYMGKVNVFIPNQEWFYIEWLPYLDKFDAVFCKSMYAYEIFSHYHQQVIYTGFTSIDCYEVGEKVMEGFHASGSSRAKGSRYLVDALEGYSRSRFHITSSFIHEAPFVNERIVFHGTLPEVAFNALRNRCLLHIYPSLVEGFGHAINEAKAVGAVVLTTGQAPMSELVTAPLIPYAKKYRIPGRLGEIVEIRPADILAALEDVLLRDDLYDIGRKNRQSFLENDLAFKARFMEALCAL